MLPIRDENPSSTTPWVTYALIGVNCFVWLLQAGMPAQVFIKTGERTMLEYLINPLTEAMSTAFKS